MKIFLVSTSPLAMPSNTKHRKIFLAICLFLFIAQKALSEGIIVDRILAVVNDEVITLSAVQDYLKIKHFIEGEKEYRYTTKISPGLLDEYIKQRLVLQEDKKIRLARVKEEEIEKELKRLTGNNSGQEIKVLGLNLSEVKTYLLEELTIQEHIEKRLGFLVRTDEEEIYKRLQEKNMEATSASNLLEIREQVRKDLFKNKLEEHKKLWLEELMEKANIRVNALN